jgi:hypothetical protein
MTSSLLAAALGAILEVIVLDPSRASVPGARVVATPASGGAPVTATADRRGVARLEVGPAEYVLVAEAEGFSSAALSGVAAPAGTSRVEITLPLAPRREELEVDDAETSRRSPGFARALTPQQIAALPDDPEEMEEALRQIAGPGAVIRVNGFRGGRLPPKSQIREIRFRTNPYAAEYHREGHVGVDIFTRPGLGGWSSQLTMATREGAWNAKPSLAAEDGPEHQRRISVSSEGPVAKGRTSLALSAQGRVSEDALAVVASGLAGAVRDLARPSDDRGEASARLEHAWGGTHTLRAEAQWSARRQDGLGTGGFDLSERAYGRDTGSTLLRAGNTGVLGRHLLSETRVQVAWEDRRAVPESAAAAVQVPGAVRSGGASVSGGRDAFALELSQDFDLSRGRHALRFGGLLEATSVRSDEATNANGTFTFSTLEDLRAGRPALYTRRTPAAPLAYRHWQAGLYVQDDIALGKEVTLGLGLRQEAQAHVRGAFHLSPRAALTLAKGGATWRLGAGLFHDWLAAEVYEQTLRVDGARERELLVDDPGWPDPFAGGAARLTVPGRWRLDDRLSLPNVLRASAGVERRLGRGRLTVDYTIERGWGELRSRNLNPPDATGRRPDPGAGNVFVVESGARSTRQSLRTDLMLGGPGARVGAMIGHIVSFARSETDGPLALAADTTRRDAERGPAADDVRHRVFGLAHADLGRGFRLTALGRAQTGMPFDITTGTDDNGDGVLSDRPAGTGRNAGRGEGQVELGLRLSWRRSFGPERTDTGGPRMRVVQLRPGDGPPDLPSMAGEERRYQVSLSLLATNALNHTNATLYGGVAGSPLFGRPLAAGPPRRIEVSAGLRF